MTELTEEQVIDQLADRLVPIYPRVQADEISRVVHENTPGMWGGQYANSYLILVEPHAKEELDKLVA